MSSTGKKPKEVDDCRLIPKNVLVRCHCSPVADRCNGLECGEWGVWGGGEIDISENALLKWYLIRIS